MTSNVRDFGARGDGHTDDTDAFLKAAEAVPAIGGVLLIPAGVYMLNRNFKVRDRAVTIRGDGIGVTRLIWGSKALSVGVGVVQSRKQGNNTDFTRITGLSLYTHGVNSGTAIVVDLSGQVDAKAGVIVNRVNPRISIDHVEIRGENSDQQGWRRAILLDHGHHAVLSNIHIVGLTRGGAEAGIHLDGKGSPTEVQISQTWCFHVNKALHVTGHVEGVKLSQCDFVAVAYGVYAERCLQLNVLNSHINASHGGIHANNVNQSSFSNLLIYKCLDSCEGFGIKIEGDSGRNIITNNIFVNVAKTADMHAVLLAGNCHHSIAANNVFQNRGSGVVCLPGAQNCTASGCVFEHPGLKCRWQQGHPSNRCTDGEPSSALAQGGFSKMTAALGGLKGRLG